MPRASWSTPVGSMKPTSFFANEIFGKGNECDAVLFGVFADRRVHRAGEAVEEARLNAAGFEQLPDIF